MSEEIGQKLTEEWSKNMMIEFPFTSLADKERYKLIDGKWWYYYPEDGVTGGKKRESADSLNNK